MSLSAFDLFKIGIGPSSSHTVGPMRAAKQFVDSLSQRQKISQVKRLKVEMFGSLGATGKGHGTPKAVLLGLMGENPETVIIANVERTIHHIREQKELTLQGNVSIQFIENDDLILHRRQTLPHHANGMTFTAYDTSQSIIEQKNYYSVGGGFILDQDSMINGQLTEDKRELRYPFSTASELLTHCHNHQLHISDIMQENEKAWRSTEETHQGLLRVQSVMLQCIHNGCQSEGLLPGGLNIPRRAPQLYQQLTRKPEATLADSLSVLDWVTLYALAVNEENAAGGRIVTAPTNGAAGIIPAVLTYYIKFTPNASDSGIVKFLLTAAAIGILYKENASISGAEVGCQGEVGSACSMAAGALTEVMGGTPQQVENAAEIAMEHNLGLTCDPIGGLVQVPCIERNAMASIKAISAARMAMKGDGSHFVSLDKVIKTMRDTGKDMKDKYKETSRGGLAVNVIEVPVNIIEC